jgi:hypothetical protein
MKIISYIWTGMFCILFLIPLTAWGAEAVAQTGYRTADLEGTWVAHEITCGASSYLTHTTVTFNAKGEVESCKATKSDGSTFSCADLCFAVSPDGTITCPTKPEMQHGIMSQDKKQIVFTIKSDSLYKLSIWTKR